MKRTFAVRYWSLEASYLLALLAVTFTHVPAITHAQSLSILDAGSKDMPYPVRCVRRASGKEIEHNAGPGSTKYLVDNPAIVAACHNITNASSFQCVANYRDTMSSTEGTIERRTGGSRRQKGTSIKAMPVAAVNKCAGLN